MFNRCRSRYKRQFTVPFSFVGTINETDCNLFGDVNGNNVYVSVGDNSRTSESSATNLQVFKIACYLVWQLCIYLTLKEF